MFLLCFVYFSFVCHHPNSYTGSDEVLLDEDRLNSLDGATVSACQSYRTHHVVVVGCVGFAVGALTVIALLTVCWRRLEPRLTSAAAVATGSSDKTLCIRSTSTRWRSAHRLSACSLNERHAAKLNNYWTLPRPPPLPPHKLLVANDCNDVTTVIAATRRVRSESYAPRTSSYATSLARRSSAAHRQPSLPTRNGYCHESDGATVDVMQRSGTSTASDDQRYIPVRQLDAYATLTPNQVAPSSQTATSAVKPATVTLRSVDRWRPTGNAASTIVPNDNERRLSDGRTTVSSFRRRAELEDRFVGGPRSGVPVMFSRPDARPRPLSTLTDRQTVLRSTSDASSSSTMPLPPRRQPMYEQVAEDGNSWLIMDHRQNVRN